MRVSVVYTVLLLCFFFSSRRRHTRSLRDWSSDVCSSDLVNPVDHVIALAFHNLLLFAIHGCRRPDKQVNKMLAPLINQSCYRSEERRVGKECRSRWSAYQ